MKILEKLFRKKDHSEFKIKKEKRRVFKMWEFNSWGHSMFWQDFEKRKFTGWSTPVPQNGDELQCKMQSGKIARFEIINAEQMNDPRDMFFAQARDLGYLE